MSTDRVGGRDRDSSGRALNARPRDSLGRPLPHGQAGFPRQPEGVVRTPPEALVEAQRLLDGGLPFHAHEVLEDAWKAATADDRAAWRALAQLAVGLTHAARGDNDAGAARLLRRGADGLAGAARTPPELDTAGVIAWSRHRADQLDPRNAAGASPARQEPASPIRLLR